ncbi:RdgB/HAM1 family non-canonical purine NTP pyrophosphatase [bacterium]|nr:RdgB/HAM1 family non-canonical purine NTP pyrophosphatase [bacterium]MCK4326384.1 RdgB/HAM1 family non-canonical purine NTP pyrophosphatase [bacterium]MCK4436734.1 RdgB/HAM1 family non-canonical purine NTP pyrophosphatase [bacterium]
MVEVVIASRNYNKIREVKEILKGLDIKFLSLKNFADFPKTEEDGNTFNENALKKAREMAKWTGRLTLAEDSGIEVDCLGGAPGVLSARFASTDRKRNLKLLKLLEGVPLSKRKARFRSAVALANPKGWTRVVGGSCRGRISFKPRGNSGFGYDPIFIIPKYNKTFGELGYPLKNKLSHRARALQKTRKILESLQA